MKVHVHSRLWHVTSLMNNLGGGVFFLLMLNQACEDELEEGDGFT